MGILIQRTCTSFMISMRERKLFEVVCDLPCPMLRGKKILRLRAGRLSIRYLVCRPLFSFASSRVSFHPLHLHFFRFCAPLPFAPSLPSAPSPSRLYPLSPVCTPPYPLHLPSSLHPPSPLHPQSCAPSKCLLDGITPGMQFHPRGRRFRRACHLFQLSLGIECCHRAPREQSFLTVLNIAWFLMPRK